MCRPVRRMCRICQAHHTTAWGKVSLVHILKFGCSQWVFGFFVTGFSLHQYLSQAHLGGFAGIPLPADAADEACSGDAGSFLPSFLPLRLPGRLQPDPRVLQKQGA